MDLIDKIMEFESGQMDDDDLAPFFQELIDCGWINHLQGSYQRIAQNLVLRGVCHLVHE